MLSNNNNDKNTKESTFQRLVRAVQTNNFAEVVQSINLDQSINQDQPTHPDQPINPNMDLNLHVLYGDSVESTVVGETILHIAIRNKASDEIVDYLIEHGAKVNAKETTTGGTALHYAAIERDLAKIKLLHRHGANLNAKSSSDATPLNSACRPACLNTTATSKNPIDPKAVELLISLGANVDEIDTEGRTPLHYAAMNGSAEAISLLIKNGANVNQKDLRQETPLHLAAKSPGDNHECIKVLLDNNASIDMKGEYDTTPLHHAYHQLNIESARLLIRRGANVNAVRISLGGGTILHSVRGEEIYEITKLLIENGADVSAKDKWGRTPLHEAAKYKNNGKIIELFIKNGAKVNAQTKERCTPLYLAVTEGPHKKIDILVNHYHKSLEELSEKNLDRFKKQFDEIDEGYFNTVKALLDAGANPHYPHVHVTYQNEGTEKLYRKLVNKTVQKFLEDKLKESKNAKNKLNSVEEEKKTPEEIEKEKKMAQLKEEQKNAKEEKRKKEEEEKAREAAKPIDVKIKEKFAKNAITCDVIEEQNQNKNANSSKKLKVIFNCPSERYQIFKNIFIKNIKGIDLQYPSKTKNCFAFIMDENKLNDLFVKNSNAKFTNELNQEIENNKIKGKSAEEQEIENKWNKDFEQNWQKNLTAAFPFSVIVATKFENEKLTLTLNLGENASLAQSYFILLNRYFRDSKEAQVTIANQEIIVTTLNKPEVNSYKGIAQPTLKEINFAKLKAEQEIEDNWDKDFLFNWKKYLENIFPVSVTVISQIEKLTLTVGLDQSISDEKAQQIAKLLEKHFASDNQPKEAKISYSSNIITVKPINKPASINYKDEPQPTLQSTNAIKTKISTLIPSKVVTKGNEQNKPTIKKQPKQASNENKTETTETAAPFTESDKVAFFQKMKEFLNDISGNILSDKLNYFIRKDIRQNRIEFTFNVDAYSSLSTENTPVGSLNLFRTMKEAINKVMQKVIMQKQESKEEIKDEEIKAEVMHFDEDKNSLKFIFTKVSKEEFFSKKDAIRKKFAKLNVPEGKQEGKNPAVKKKEVDTKTESTSMQIQSFEQLQSEIQVSLKAIKNDGAKTTNLLSLLNTLNKHSPLKAKDTSEFQSYMLLATFILSVISKEGGQNTNLYNVRSIVRHAYYSYNFDKFYEIYSPFFTTLMKNCQHLFSTNMQQFFTQQQSLTKPANLLNEELQLYGALLERKLLKADPTDNDKKDFREKIKNLQAQLNNNNNDESKINSIYFAILQYACQIGEAEPNTPEGAVYGALHFTPNLKTANIQFLIDIAKEYLLKITPQVTIKMQGNAT